ncbi:hypothetical protein ES703_58635 [subsurface metagenome]
MSKYHRHRRTNFRLIRTLIGIIASFLILFSVKTAQPDFITMFATTAFAVPSFGLTFIGSVISYVSDFVESVGFSEGFRMTRFNTSSN